MNSMTDEQLILAYRERHDERLLEALIARYTHSIYNFSRHYAPDADAAYDITQETFVKVWQKLDSFDISRQFRSWLFTIAKRTALDWLKKKQAVPFSKIQEYQPDFLETVADTSREADIPRLLMRRDLELALNELPAASSSLIKLHLDEGFKFRELAKTLKQPLNTVKSRYRRSLSLLKSAFLKNEQ